MGDEVEREIERGDECADSDGDGFGPATVTDVSWVGFHRDDFTDESDGFFGGAAKGIGGSQDFESGIGSGFAGFLDEGLREFFFAEEKLRCAVVQDFGALASGDGGHFVACQMSCGNRFFYGGGIGRGHASDGFLGILVDDGNRGFGQDGLTSQDHRSHIRCCLHANF